MSASAARCTRSSRRGRSMRCSPREPEDRRHLVEEAAGLGKFKRRKHRAELKLARVATQVERAQGRRGGGAQAAAPAGSPGDGRRARREARGRDRGAPGTDRAARPRGGRRAPRRRRGAPRRDRDRAAKRAGEADRAARGAPAAPRTSSPTPPAAARRPCGALYRLQGASERLALRRESAAGLAARLRDELAEAERAAAGRSDEAIRALEQAAAAAAAAARDAAAAHGEAAERARRAHARPRRPRPAPRRRGRVEARRRPCRAAGRRGRPRARRPAVREARTARLVALASARERLGVRREAIVTLGETLTRELEEARVARSPRRADARRAGAARERGRPGGAFRRHRARRRRRTGTLDAGAAAGAGAGDRGARGHPPGRERARGRRARRSRSPRSRPSPAPSGRSPPRSPGVRPRCSPPTRRRARAARAGPARRGSAASRSSSAAIGGEPRTRRRTPVRCGAGLRRPRRAPLLDGIWLVPPSACSTPARHRDHAEGHGYDTERGELWFAGETAEALLLEMDARRRGARRRGGRARRPRCCRARPRPTRRRRLRRRPRLPTAPSRICASACSIVAAAARSPTSRGRLDGGSRRAHRYRPPDRGAARGRGSRSAPSRPASSARSCAVSPRSRREAAARGRRRDGARPGGRGRRRASRRQRRGSARSRRPSPRNSSRRDAALGARRSRGGGRRRRGCSRPGARRRRRAPRAGAPALALDADMLARLVDAVAGLGAGARPRRALADPARSARPGPRRRRRPALVASSVRSCAASVRPRSTCAAAPTSAAERATQIQVELARLDGRGRGGAAPPRATRAPTSRPKATTAPSSRAASSGSTRAARRSAR